MDEATRRFVRERAEHRCEYCRLPQTVGALVRFHIEHIVSRQHGGGDEIDNLALACPNCNWHKGPNLAGIDPKSQRLVALFNPRVDLWDEHFERQSLSIIGRSPAGRATVHLLRFNDAERLDVRRELDAEPFG